MAWERGPRMTRFGRARLPPKFFPRRLKYEPLAVLQASSYYAVMAEPATKTLIYKAALALLSGPGIHPYESTDILAAGDSEAIDKATEWSRNPQREVAPGTYLVVTIDGRSIHSKKLDWTNAPRP
jgi:hypothetical protein